MAMGNSKMPHIVITEEVRTHLASHFNNSLTGSKFYCHKPEEVIEKAKELFPEKFKTAIPEKDGRIRLSFKFPEDIGISNVISVNDLTYQERAKIRILNRQGKKVRTVRINRVNQTNECQMILSSDWQLITMFPGEIAPPLPPSPNVHDEYWDNHVLIESEE